MSIHQNSEQPQPSDAGAPRLHAIRRAFEAGLYRRDPAAEIAIGDLLAIADRGPHAEGGDAGAPRREAIRQRLLDAATEFERNECGDPSCHLYPFGALMREAAAALDQRTSERDEAIAATLPEWDRIPTDRELAAQLPLLPLLQRVEAIIRKYVGGAVSKAYDGDTAAPKADAQIARYLVGKMRPWLRSPEHQGDAALAPGRREREEP